ncbi:hypothetical protein AWC38_SpisGene7926 [Stylophora pistillata]|uniref:Uncharacterized protein n=1 Tax=Stylophora pistillata TaxID=50429 RepID=A0A2B4SDD0_STYPI|nr:hypothetical protein AWC38_SpisGene7926 [Stylophora pistillata]
MAMTPSILFLEAPNTQGWTPGSEGASLLTPSVTNVVQSYNTAMDTTANLTERERCQTIEQYLEYCKEQCHEPLSGSTMFKILEIREASQRKSLQGLDNTAADCASGFQTLETLVETLDKGGMEMQWYLYVRPKLRDAKRYLKTDYRLHCQPDDSTCADHSRRFALSDPVEPDFQHQCSHEHQSTCGDCQLLKKVLQDVRQGIEDSPWTPYNLDQREDLLYDFNLAQENMLLWKAHIMRSIN